MSGRVDEFVFRSFRRNLTECDINALCVPEHGRSKVRLDAAGLTFWPVFLNKNYVVNFDLVAKILIILAEIKAAVCRLSFGVIHVFSDKTMSIIHQACENLHVLLERAYIGS